MGNSVTRKEIDKQIQSEYKSLRKYCDEIYGDITIKYALLQRIVDQPQNFQKRLKDVDHIDSILHSHRFYCRGTDMCSTNRVFYVLVEYRQHSLEKEIFIRHQQQRHFSKQEACSIMYQMVDVINAIRRLDRKGMRLPLHNKLFILTKEKEVRVVDPLVVESKDWDSFEMQISDDPDRRFLFVPPQTMALLRHNEKTKAQHQQTQEKSQVWALGVCFLQMLLLCDATVAYDFVYKTVDVEKVRDMVSEVSGVYGEEVHHLVQWMLRGESGQRPKWSQLQKDIGKVAGVKQRSEASSMRSPPRKQSLSLASRVVSHRGST